MRAVMLLVSCHFTSALQRNCEYKHRLQLWICSKNEFGKLASFRYQTS